MSHIENKPPHGKWQANQPENDRKRAKDRMGPLRYVDFQTVLLAPVVFIASHPTEAAHFDLALTYEEVAAYVPEFKIGAVSGDAQPKSPNPNLDGTRLGP